MIYVLPGGAPLNFKVVGGTAQPASPSENMIWVNTDTAISEWAFSAERPANPVEGMVWFQTDTFSPAPFNALKKNNITVYPTGCKQYVNGAWVDKTAKTYQGGAWVDWLPDGTIYDVNFGGAIVPISVVAKESNATVTITESGIVYSYSSGQNAQSAVVTDETIDLTAYKTLLMDATISGIGQPGYEGRMVVNTTKWGIGGSQAASKVFSANNEKTTYELDISSLSGLYYLGTNGGLNGTIHRIRLIK